MFLSFIFMYILSCPSSSGRLPGSILAIPSTALFCAKLRYLSWSLHTQFGVYCPMSSDYHSDYCSLHASPSLFSRPLVFIKLLQILNEISNSTSIFD